MSEDLEKKIKVLERKLRLFEEAMHQTTVLRKKYDEARESLKSMNTLLEQKVVERTQKVEDEHKYLQAIINSVETPIMVIKEDYSVDLMNSVLYKKIDFSLVKDVNNPKCYEVSYRRSTPCHQDNHPCLLQKVLATKKHEKLIHKHFSEDGEKHYIERSASPLFDKENKCIGIIESANDVTEYLEVQDELREQKSVLDFQAHHDALTGLPNRLLFNDRLNQSIEKAKRNKERLAVFFIDLDRFKEINDSLGHKSGDIVLQEVSSRITSIIRKEDTVSRLGGDEFTILMTELHRAQDASLLAQKILDVLSEPIQIEENTLYVSSSIGISLYPQDDTDAQNLLKYADAAMYKAKAEGRNNFQFYSFEMTQMAFEHVAMESSLRQGVDNGEFVVYYQPQIDGESGQFLGMEALVRWNHPTLGMVYPLKFIPLAEEIGLIIALDRFVMKTAMKQIVEWYAKGLNPGVMALNLSMKQLHQKDFIDVIKNMLEETQCKPEWIELEVTENNIMTNQEDAIKLLHQLTDIGIKLAIDDFGTGYSSLSYLSRLPIDKLKIDKSFIQELPFHQEDVAITRAIIALAKSLNLRVIAEGVETKEQKDFLVANGCKSIQGYFYAKAISYDNLEKMLTAKS